MLKSIVDGCDPIRGTKHSACVDVFAAHSAEIKAGKTAMIGLGVVIDTDFIKEKFTYDTAAKFKDGDFVQFTSSGALNSTEFENFMNTHYLQLMLRSSLGKEGLILPNGVGVIDLDYNSEIRMIIHNPIKGFNIIVDRAADPYGSGIIVNNLHDVKIEKGDKIGQIMLCEHKTDFFNINTEEVRTGGFGSTGK